MITEKEIFSAFQHAIKVHGSQNKLSKATKVPQSTINDICNGNKQIGNIVLSNFLKLFPNMHIDFFGSGYRPLYPEKILKLINHLSGIEQEEIYEAIITCYPHVQDNKMTKTLMNKE